MYMVSKTISLSEEAYNILKSWKDEDDSFSSGILKLSKKQDLLKHAGILSEERGEAVLDHVERLRDRSKQRYQ